MSTETKKRGLIKGMKYEFKKITWPTKNDVVNATIVVVTAIIGISILVKLLDMLFQFILSFTV